MDDLQKLQANIACAKVCKYVRIEVTTDYDGSPLCLIEKDYNSEWDVMDIFTTPKQCLEVVKKLGKEYDIAICPYTEDSWCYTRTSVLTREDFQFPSYEEAVAAAALEITQGI